MTNQQTEKNKEKNDKDTALKSDPETLDTTDPQEHMEGPVSSLMHKTGKGFDSEESEKEAKEKKEKDE